MSQYLLSTYAVEGEVPGSPAGPEEMQEFMQRVIVLEAEMDESGTFVFGGALQGSDAATVVRMEGGEAETTQHRGEPIMNAVGLPEQRRR